MSSSESRHIWNLVKNLVKAVERQRRGELQGAVGSACILLDREVSDRALLLDACKTYPSEEAKDEKRRQP